MRQALWRPLALAGLTLAALLVVLVVGGQPDADPPDNSTDPRSLPPSGTVDTVPEALLASPWFVETADFASESELRGFRLWVGLLDGTVTRDVSIGLANLNPSSQWSGALPFAGGPYGGQVLYGYFDGMVSTLRVVSAEDGDDRLVLETDAVVHQAVLDPLDDTFYYLALEPTTRREIGIFRGTVPDGEAEQLIPARASPEATQIASRLLLTPDGSRLVTHDCRDDDCRLRAYLAATGELLFDVAAPASDPYGITDSEIILSGASAAVPARCPEASCPAIAFDLESGRQRPLGEVCSTATIVDGKDGPILMSDVGQAPTCGQAPYRIVAIDVRSGQVVGEFTFETAARELVVNTRDQGIDLPDGWLLLGSDGLFYSLETAAPLEALTLVRLEGGATLDLPMVSLGHR